MICRRLKTKTRHYGVGRLQKDLLVKAAVRRRWGWCLLLPYGPEIQDRQNVWGAVICLSILIQNILALWALFPVPFTGESTSVKYLPVIQRDGKEKKRILKDSSHLCEWSLRNAGFVKGQGWYLPPNTRTQRICSSLTICVVFNPLTFLLSFVKCVKSMSRNLEFDKFVSKNSFLHNVKLNFLVSLTSWLFFFSWI